MHNKIKSIAISGKRKPGRPFNTTTYPWRSLAIGRSFTLKHPPAGAMRIKLREEGRHFEVKKTHYGFKVTRIA